MSEWIKWDGKGVRPVLADQIVEVRMRDGSTSESSRILKQLQRGAK